MQSTHMFWPSNRSLFRQRGRLRSLLPIAAVVAVTCLVLAAFNVSWA